MRAANRCSDKPAFRNAMRRRRCLIPADGFYEWSDDGQPQASVFRAAEIRRTDRLRRIVGDLDRAERRGSRYRGDRHHPANRLLAAIHDRMPVIVPPDAFDLWLDCAKVDDTTAAALIVPAPDALLEGYEISTAVNRTANDNPELIAPEPVRRTTAPVRRRAPAKDQKPDDQLSLRQARSRKRSGKGACFEARLQHLARIEDAVGVEHALEAAHQLDRHRVLVRGRMSRFITPTPCSAEIEPPNFFTTANTTALTSSQRARNSSLSAPTGCVTL